MKKFVKVLALALVLVLSVSMLAACDGGTSTSGTSNADSGTKVLKIGTNAEFPPFEFMGDDGQPDGFDIALIKAIGEEIGMEVQIENMEFKSLIGAIESGNIQGIIAGMTVDDERKKSVDFSDGYYEAHQMVLVRKDSDITKTEDLNGKKIAVQEGTTGDFVASGDPDWEFILGVSLQNTEVSRMKKGLDAVIELKNGRVDAVIIDSNPAQVFAEENADDIKIVDSIQCETETYAIAVSKDEPDLLNSINTALKTLKDNGKYDEILKQYIEQ